MDSLYTFFLDPRSTGDLRFFDSFFHPSLSFIAYLY